MATTRRVVLITGVNGYIATHTAAAFLRAGFAVRGTVRTRTPALVDTLERTLGPYHDGDRFEVVEVPDIGERGAFDRVVENVHSIAHLASPVSTTTTDPGPLLRAAVSGTTSLLTSAFAAARRDPATLKSVVFMSTISAIFSPDRPPGHVFTETDWNDHAERETARLGADIDGYTLYQASKTAAERAFWDAAAKEEQELHRPLGFGMVALCPAPTLGPPLYLPHPISRLSMRVRDIYDIFHGTAPVPAFSPVRSTFVDVRDVADCVVAAVERHQGLGGVRPLQEERYLLVGNKQPVSPRGIADVLRERFPERRERIPVGRGTAEEEAEVLKGWGFDAGKARERLLGGRGWIGFEESVVESAEAFLRLEGEGEKRG